MAVRNTTIALLFALAICQTCFAQQENPERAYNNTLQWNVTGAVIKTAGIAYTRHVAKGNNFMVEAGYAFPRWPGVSIVIENLEKETVTGFFIKAGFEFCHYRGKHKFQSFAVLPTFAQGSFDQEIIIPHAFGELRETLSNNYTAYGFSFQYNQVFFNIGDHWFIEGTAELSLTDVQTNAILPLKEYPGVGFHSKVGIGFRMLGKVGYRF